MAQNKRLNAVITIGGSVASSLRSSLTDTKTRIGQVGSVVRKLEREQRSLNASIKTYTGMGRSVAHLQARYATVTAEIDKQTRALKRLRAIEEKRQQARQLGGKIVATGAATTSAALPQAAAFKRAAAFEYELQLVANTAELTKTETQALGQAVLNASRNAGQSASDMLQAIGFLVAAGMEVKTAQETVLTVGRTATASGAQIEDLARAAYTLNDALKIDPADMQGALDIMAQAGKEGNVELRDMAQVLPVLGSGFVALKMKGREATATMAAMLQIARKGAASADQAGNNMLNFLAKVMSPETLKKAEKNFGLDLHAVITNAQKKGENPLEAAIKAIGKATKGGDQKLIGDLFQDMQVQNFIRPMIQQWERYEEIKAKSLAARGVTDRDFDLVMQTSKKAVDDMAQAGGRAAISIGKALAPAITSVARAITPMLEGVTKFVDGNPTLVSSVLLGASALGVLRLAGLGAKLAWVGMSGAAAAAAAPLKLATTALLALGRALLMNPVGLAITGIAAVGYGGYKLWQKFKGKKEEMEAPQGQLPGLPSVAGRPGSNVADNRQYNFTIQQQPGQDSRALAETIKREMDKLGGINSRGLLADGIGVQ